MNCVPGRCIKCNESFQRGKGIGPNFTDIVLNVDNEYHLHVGLCSNCELEESEWQEALDAANVSLGSPLSGKVIGVINRQSYSELIKAAQGGNCSECGKELGDNYISNCGLLRHEICKPAKTVRKRDKEEVKSGGKAKEWRENNKRGPK